MNDSDTSLFLGLFPFLLVGMWLANAAVLGAMSGWFALQRQFPRGTEEPLLTFRRLSGHMGMGVKLNGILTLGACPSGLRIEIWRGSYPFQRPFLVPWAEISAEPKTWLFMPMAQLRLGNPQVGKLMIDAGIWQKLASRSPGHATPLATPGPFPKVTHQHLARGLALQWVAISGVAAAFLFFGSRVSPGPPPVPLANCIVIPVIVFGIAQLIRYARKSG